MSTYLQGGTDMMPQIAPFQPDFGLVQKTLSTLQNRYDQGFASLKNVYNQVLNAPLSDVDNRAVRDQFVKEAQRRLQDLASVDLSLPENQTMAENVFSPFWQDNMIVQDTGLTKWYQNETMRAKATRDSLDEKVRSQYSDVAAQYLQNGWEKLQDAGRDPDKYSKLEKRRFVPFQDVQAYLDDRAKAEGLKIEWKAPDGPYMKTIRGGTESLPAFETFAENALGDKFDEQFKISGIVRKESEIKRLQAINPGLSDEAALDQLSHSTIADLKKQYEQKSTSLQTELTSIEKRLEGYGKTGLSTAQQEEVNALFARQDKLTAQFKQTTEKLNKYKDEKKTSQDWVAQADSYFADSFKQSAIRMWANEKASNQQIEYDINPVWRENMTIDYQKQDLALKLRAEDRQERELEWKMKHPGRRGGSGSGDGYDGYGDSPDEDDALNPETTGRYEGPGSTDITKLGSAYERYVEKEQSLWDAAHSAIFDIKTGVGSLLYSLNIDDSKAGKYISVMDKLGRDPDSKLNDEEKAVFKEVGDKLKDYTGIESRDFGTARAAMLEMAKKKLSEKTVSGGAGLSDEDMMVLDNYTNATNSIKKYESLEKDRKQIVQGELSKQPDVYNNILINRNGKKDVATAKDYEKVFRKSYALYKGGPELTPRQLAEAYISGDLGVFWGDHEMVGYKGSYFDQIDHGEPYMNAIMDIDEKEFNQQFQELKKDLSTLQNAHGMTEDQKALREKLNQRVSRFLPEYQSQTGKMGVVVGYDLTDKHSGGVATGMINEAANAGNREGIYIDREYSKKDGINDAVIQLMSQGREELKKHISKVQLNTVGVNGRPSLEIIMKPVSGNDKLQIAGMDMTELAGKKIEIDLNPQPSGALLRKIRYNSGFYVYGDLLEGGHYDSDPIMEAAGFRCTVSADRATNPTGMVIRYKRKLFNVEKGMMEDQPEKKEFYSFADHTTDEAMDYVHQLFRANVRDNATLQKLYQQRNQGLVTIDDLRAAYNQRKGG